MTRLRPCCPAVALLVLLATATLALAYPKPAAVPYRWQLDFDSGPLRMYVDAERGQAYWYLTYMVTNRTTRTQVWAPQLTMFTDAGEIFLSGAGVPSRVETDILELLGNPLLERQSQVIGDLLVAAENAKEGLAVWPAATTSVNEFSIFVRGISGESARVSHPISGDAVVLYKTLQQDYLVPGDALARGSTPVETVGQRWILR